MTPGPELKAVALPDLPEGYRWVIDRKYYDGWTETKHMGIHLQERVNGIFGWVLWKTIESRKIQPRGNGDMVGGYSSWESLAECAERLAKEIFKSHIAKLENLLEEESIIGVYEQSQNEELPYSTLHR